MSTCRLKSHFIVIIIIIIIIIIITFSYNIIQELMSMLWIVRDIQH